MKNYVNATVKCPSCGRQFKVKQFTSINPYTMDKQREGIFHSSLFIEKCPYCHHVSQYPYSFSYRESKGHVTLIYAVNETEKESFLREYADEEDVRITDTMDALTEKIMIFHQGYDDRIIEVEKKLLLDEMKKENPKISSTHFYYRTGAATAYAGMDGPVIAGEDKEMVLEMVPVDEIYRRIDESVSGKLEDYKEQTLIVDQDWAGKFIEFAGLNEDEITGLEAETRCEERNVSASTFFSQVEQLEMMEDEKKAADLITAHFDEIWNKILKENGTGVRLAELEDSYDDIYNAVNDFSMILMNEKKYTECMRILQTILNTTDFSDDRLSYMNMKRDYMECIGMTQGSDAELKYLEEWMKEDPEDAYLYGTEIDVWLRKDPEKADQLAWKYVDTPLKDNVDEWLLDSCMNVAMDRKDTKLKEKVQKRMKH